MLTKIQYQRGNCLKQGGAQMGVKKTVLLFLVVFLAFSIVGCGGGSSKPSRTSEQSGPVETSEPSTPVDPSESSSTPVDPSGPSTPVDENPGVTPKNPEPTPEFVALPLKSSITNVQPMTGLVLWTTNDEHNKASEIQLEYRYVGYNEIVDNNGNYNWTNFEAILNGVASRKHQAIIRFYDTYPGKQTTVPGHIKKRSDYQETQAKSEGQNTYFPDWSNKAYQDFIIEFFNKFAARYDYDRRIAFLQVGFGLWAEYHIYDGPRILGKTFPDKDYQTRFFNSMANTFKQLYWSVSIDAADSSLTPFAANKNLIALPFGLFDDSFLCSSHKSYNEPSWNFFGTERYKTYPAGGEISYYNDNDQKNALRLPNGPNGESFESMASRFHISYIIGDGQPDYQSMSRIKSAGMALGYKFKVTAFSSSSTQTKITIKNTGIAPLYYDAYVSVNGKRASESLKYLQPNTSKTFLINTPAGSNPVVKIECDRLVSGQQIQYEANL